MTVHRPTAYAVGAVVYLTAKLVHEGVGHGGACLATGSDLVAFSTAWANCETSTETAAVVVDVGGTFANLLAAALLWPFMGRPTDPIANYAVVLATGVNLLMGLGYMFADPLFGFGDWTDVFDVYGVGTGPRIGFGLVAGAAYVLLAMRWMKRATPIFGSADPKRRARTLLTEPYLVVGGVLMTAAAATSPYGPALAVTSALATLGGTSALAWLPFTLDGGVAPDRAVAILRAEAAAGKLLGSAVEVLAERQLWRGIAALGRTSG